MNFFKTKRAIKIVMTGQRRSGVSTVAGAMAGARPKNPLPSNGVDNWNFAKGRYDCQITEVATEGRIEWSNYLGDAHAIVYVVDACTSLDNDFSDAREDLKSLLGCEALIKNKPLVIVFNKYGEPNSISRKELKGLINYRQLKKNWTGAIKTITTRANSFKGSWGLRKGKKMLMEKIGSCWEAIDGSVQKYKALVDIREQRNREKRRDYLQKIRNTPSEEDVTAAVATAESVEDHEKETTENHELESTEVVVEDQKGIADFVEGLTTAVCDGIEKNIDFNEKSQMLKHLRAAEDLLQRKQLQIAAIEQVNGLFFAARLNFAEGGGKSCPQKVRTPRRCRKRKMDADPPQLQQKLFK